MSVNMVLNGTTMGEKIGRNHDLSHGRFSDRPCFIIGGDSSQESQKNFGKGSVAGEMNRLTLKINVSSILVLICIDHIKFM